MQEEMKHIKVNGIEYPLVFNLNVMEKIQEKYETIENWGNLTDGKNQEVDLKALKYGILEMINEGIDIENEKKENKMEFLKDKQVGRIITELSKENILNNVQKVVIESTKVENNLKNV